jgi:ribosomal protein L11 methyltransferase
MSWIEITIDATLEAVDWIYTLLARTDYLNQLQIEPIAPVDTATPWTLTLRVYLPDDRYIDRAIADLLERLSALQRTGLMAPPKITPVADLELATSPPEWRIGQRFVIVAEDTPDRAEADAIPLRVSATRAFGSGLHPATILSLQLLERYVMAGMRVLDLGSGSGILTVAIAKLGATVLALDNDPFAVAATATAIQQNGVAAQATVQQGSLGYGSRLGHWMGAAIAPIAAIDPSQHFDLIVANIFARVHIALAPDYRQALQQSKSQPGSQSGLLIVAGFTADYEASIVEALAEVGFEVCDRLQLAEWVGLAYRLRYSI